MIKYFGIKTTANRLAKDIIQDRGQSGAEVWCELTGIDLKDFTQKEIDDVERCLDKQTERVRKFLELGE